jgi:hypothetical protein
VVSGSALEPDSMTLWIRIRIDNKCWIWIRIRIKSIRILNPAHKYRSGTGMYLTSHIFYNKKLFWLPVLFTVPIRW